MKLIIPYRLKSSRFPNKFISKFLGIPLIEHSLKLCEEFGNDVIVTAPKEDFVKEVSDLQEKYGFQFIPTSPDCKTGTDRVIELSKRFVDDYYVLIPADEPLIDRNELKRVLSSDLGDFNLCYSDFYDEKDCISNLSAKIVSTYDDYLLYQSRNVIPTKKDGTFDYKDCKKCVGIKIFSYWGLRKLYDIETKLDKIESLEELKVVELGHRVKLHKIKHIGFGIDISEQVKLLEDRYYANTKHK
jgi:3-deoxy-manno-octulosonate cytidylyltransferase (CMP-KDO synthetase)|tara:strand:+ start:668 stop:1396 length:729 start_codon:yes stop_codon:yes gene_type:complete